jgi:hypothetical protein
MRAYIRYRKDFVNSFMFSILYCLFVSCLAMAFSLHSGAAFIEKFDTALIAWSQSTGDSFPYDEVLGPGASSCVKLSWSTNAIATTSSQGPRL